MKTIDLLVQELPALGGFPDGAIEAGFLCSEGTLCFVDADGNCPSEWRINMNHEVDDSWVEVSREQYESALAAKNDGWVDWGGGECQVPCGTAVDVKHRCGAVSENQQAWTKHHKESDVVVNPFSNAGQAFWRHENSVMDIIAYRLHQTQEVTEADDEADLNECIGQDVAPEWSGDGLPPVGCECELKFKYHDSDVSWSTVAVLWQRDDDTLVEYIENKLKNTILLIRNTSERVDFRPIRSEADKKRDEAVAQLNNFVAMGKFALDEDLAYAVYDAIAAGKIPGVKLEG